MRLLTPIYKVSIVIWMCQELRSILSSFDPFLTALLIAITTKVAYFHPKFILRRNFNFSKPALDNDFENDHFQFELDFRFINFSDFGISKINTNPGSENLIPLSGESVEGLMLFMHFSDARSFLTLLLTPSTRNESEVMLTK